MDPFCRTAFLIALIRAVSSRVIASRTTFRRIIIIRTATNGWRCIPYFFFSIRYFLFGFFLIRLLEIIDLLSCPATALDYLEALLIFFLFILNAVVIIIAVAVAYIGSSVVFVKSSFGTWKYQGA